MAVEERWTVWRHAQIVNIDHALLCHRSLEKLGWAELRCVHLRVRGAWAFVCNSGYTITIVWFLQSHESRFRFLTLPAPIHVNL